MQKFDCLVIGGGSGGVRFARIAAQNGAKVAIIEQQHWGGTCVNIGCVPKKLMAYGAGFGKMAESAKAYGWDFTQQELDWGSFQRRRSSEIARLDQLYVQNLEKAGVTLFEGHARFSDPQTVEIEASPLSPKMETQKLTAPVIIIATGGEPIRLSIPGLEHGLVSDDMFSLEKCPESLAIIGGGYIGLEFAGIMAGYGAKIDLIYRADLPLRGFDREVREDIARKIPFFGIQSHKGASPEKIEKQGDKFRLFCDSGLEIEAEKILFAVGRKPNLGGLGLENTSVSLTEDGRHLRAGSGFCETTQKGIYALGDVMDKVNLTPFAIAQGQTLAEMLYPNPKNSPRKWQFETVPKAVFFQTPLSCVGMTEEEAVKKEDVKIFTSRFTPLFASLDTEEVKEREKIFLKLIVSQKTDKLLGAAMVGKDAPEIIQMLAVCLAAQMTKAQLDATLALHPTTAEEFVTLTSAPRLVSQNV